MNISLTEAAQLEADGARRRLERAIAAHQNFLSAYGTVLDGGFVYRADLSPEVRASLDKERDAIQVELDCAWRQLRHCESNLESGAK
jgi:hypothetical protein